MYKVMYVDIHVCIVYTYIDTIIHDIGVHWFDIGCISSQILDPNNGFLTLVSVLPVEN